MRTPTPAQLLELWERGDGASAAARGVLLLDSEGDAADGTSIALPLGQRDARLLRLRARLFGPEIDATARCPGCGVMVEATFRCDDLLVAPPADAGASTFEHHSGIGGVHVAFRLPTSADLLALASCSTMAMARAALLERCVLTAQSGDTPCSPRDLPEAVQAEIAQLMADLDPQADVQLAFRCQECGAAWQPLFDIAPFLWQELHAWALRLLRDVDALARNYHWSEADILALTPRRRQAYLELCAP